MDPVPNDSSPVPEVAPHDLPGLGDLLAGSRAGGGALRVAVVGLAHPLPAAGEAVARQLAHDALHAATVHAPDGDLSFSLTWSPDRLDVLVVCGSAAGERPDPVAVPPERFDATRARVVAADGTLRVTSPAAGGFVAAASVPLPGTEAGPPPVGGTVASPADGPTGARIGG